MTEDRNKYGLTPRQERTNKAVAAIVVSLAALTAAVWVLWQIAN